MATELAKAYVQIVPSAKGISGSISSALSGESVSAGQSSGSSIGSNLVSTLTKVVAAAGIGKMVSSAINEGMEFDSAVSQLAATMGTTVDQIQELRDCAKEMGATTAFSATEAAEGLNTLAMAGLNADEQMETLPTVLNLASAGALSLDSAASYVTGTIKGFGDEMSNAEYYADLMAKGATLANTDVAGLGEALSGAAANASNYGQQADSVTLSLLKLAEQNVTGSEAATSLNRAMADLYTPTDAAKGALEELGVACYDSSGNARDFNDVCDDLSAALSEYDAETQNAYKDTIFTTNGLNAFNKMTATSTEKTQEFKDALADASGSAMQQADTQLDNLAGDITLFKSALSGLEIAVSDALTPALREIVSFGSDALTALTEGFSEGGIGGAVSAIKDLVSQLLDTLISSIPDWINSGVEMIKNFASGMSGEGGSLKITIMELIMTLINSIAENLPELVQAGVDIVTNMITGMLNSLPELVSMGFEMTTNLVNGIVESIPVLIEAVVGMIDQFVASLTEMLPVVLEGGVTLFMAIVDAIPTVIDALLSALPEIITTIVDFVVGALPQIIDAAVEMLYGLVDAIPTIVDALTQNLPDIITAIINGIIDAVPQVLDAAITLFMALVDAIPQVIISLAQALPDIIVSITTAIVGAVPDLLAAAVEMFMALVEAIPQIVVELGKALPQIIQAIITGLASLPQQMASIGLDMVKGLWNGINNAVSWVLEKIKGFGQSILNGIKGFFGIKSPSKLFRDEVGAFLPAGLAIGVDENADLAVDAADEMADATVEAAKKAADVAIPGPSLISDFTGQDYTIEPIAVQAFSDPLPDASMTVEETVSTKMDEIQVEFDKLYALLMEYLPEMANMEVVMDTGAAVGAMAPKMNSALGKLGKKEARMA